MTVFIKTHAVPCPVHARIDVHLRYGTPLHLCHGMLQRLVGDNDDPYRRHMYQIPSFPTARKHESVPRHDESLASGALQCHQHPSPFPGRHNEYRTDPKALVALNQPAGIRW